MLLDEMGESWTRTHFHRKAWEWAQGLYALEQLGLLNEEAAALGVGAGTESILFYLTNRVGMVYATDIYGEGSFASMTAPQDMLTNPERYARIPFRPAHLRTQYMDGTRLEFNDNSFDFAFSFSSIEHFGGHRAAGQAVREMGRVVKPGGAVVLTTEAILSGEPYPEFFLPGELEQYLVKENGLVLLEDIDCSLSDETLKHPVDFARPGFLEAIPHIICKIGQVYWTSVCLVLIKPEVNVSQL